MWFVPHLADSLTAIAEEGDDVFYKGEIARKIVEHVQSGGGLLTMDDLADYSPDVRDSLMIDIGDWQIGNQPAAGYRWRQRRRDAAHVWYDAFAEWSQEKLRRLVDSQRAVMLFS